MIRIIIIIGVALVILYYLYKKREGLSLISYLDPKFTKGRHSERMGIFYTELNEHVNDPNDKAILMGKVIPELETMKMSMLGRVNKSPIINEYLEGVVSIRQKYIKQMKSKIGKVFLEKTMDYYSK